MIEFPGGVAQGSCRAGSQTCEDGHWSACRGAIAPKETDRCEDNNDDNCNGLPMDHCTCAAGETQPCGTDVGVCEKGVQTCGEDGSWGQSCEGEVKPSKEICDGLADEDCDGLPDSENCECINGQTEPCGQSNQGECRLGTRTCADGKWSGCVGEVSPKPELCDGRGRDEDCDGLADTSDSECDCNHGQKRDCSVPGKRGDCGLGFQTCENGKWTSRCSQRFTPQLEQCGKLRDLEDGVLRRRVGDEDCDGQIDESDAANGFRPGGAQQLGVDYMLDEDGDGWGAVRRRGQPEHAVFRRYCVGRESDVPRGWQRANLGKVARDCGDCVDGGNEVHPNYSGGYRVEPNACLKQVAWRGGAFDYDCSGRAELQYTKMFRCDLEDSQCLATRQGGWLNKIPTCGSTDWWSEKDDCIENESPGKSYCGQKLGFDEKTQGCQ